MKKQRCSQLITCYNSEKKIVAYLCQSQPLYSNRPKIRMSDVSFRIGWQILPTKKGLPVPNDYCKNKFGDCECNGDM